MNIKSLEAEVDLRFNLADSELDAAAKSVRIYHRRAKQYGWNRKLEHLVAPRRTISITKGGQLIEKSHYNKETIKTRRYTAKVEYKPSVNLTRDLIEYELSHLEQLSDLPFRDHSA